MPAAQDLSRVKRRECLEWLPKVQRADGSFGELVGPEGSVRYTLEPRLTPPAQDIPYAGSTTAVS
jgi:hypothetical protein